MAELTQADQQRIIEAFKLVQLNKLEEAASIAENVYSKDPTHLDTLMLLAEINLALGNHSIGIDLLNQILARSPDNSTILGRLGFAYLKLNNLVEAKQYLEHSVEITPNKLDNQMFLAAIYQEENNWDAASDIYLNYAEKYNSTEIFHHAGNGFMGAKDFRQAERFYRLAIKANKSAWQSYAALVEALSERVLRDVDSTYQQLHEIYRICDLAEPHLAPSKGLTQILFARANALNQEGRYQEARKQLEKILTIDPEHNEAKNNLVLLMLGTRDFTNGWPLFSKRVQFNQQNLGLQSLIASGVIKPEWQGQEIPEKTLLVTSEQGIGDQIMHTQQLLSFDNENTDIILTCNEKLVSLFTRSFPKFTVLADTRQIPDELIPKINYQTSLIDVAHKRGIDLENYKTPSAYLKVHDDLVNDFKDRYSKLSSKPKIGIAWQSNAPTGGRKSIQLQQWKRLLKLPNYQFVSIQYSADPQEVAKFNSKNGTNLYFDESFDPFIDVEKAAAQIATLDLVISISNASVHLAGALGIPVWLLLPKSPVWHWFKEGTHSPWYATVEIIRQTKPMNWSPLLSTISNRLERITKANLAFNSENLLFTAV